MPRSLRSTSAGHMTNVPAARPPQGPCRRYHRRGGGRGERGGATRWGTNSQAERADCYGGLAAAFWLRSYLATTMAIEHAGKRGYTQAPRGCCARGVMSSPRAKSGREPSVKSAEMSSQFKERK